ncbi:hypothetical protein VTN96DRAFT_4013 [Rasamsonia emersonii]
MSLSHPPRRDLLRHQPPVTSQPPNRPSSSQRYGSYQDRLYLINDPATYRLRLLYVSTTNNALHFEKWAAKALRSGWESMSHALREAVDVEC